MQIEAKLPKTRYAEANARLLSERQFHMRPLRTRKIALAAAALIGLGLAGCSTPAEQVSPAVESAVPETEATTEAPTVGLAEPEVDRSGSYSKFRDRVLPYIEEEVGCESGEVLIGGQYEDLQITGDCAMVTVRGDHAYVVADNVDQLTVTGASNTVIVRTVGEVIVSGSDNVVHWQGPALDVAASDDGNTLVQHEDPVAGEPTFEAPYQHGTDLPTEFDPESLINENYTPSS